MEHMGPFTFVCLRSFITSVLLFAVSFVRFKKTPQDRARTRETFKLGALLGIILVVAVSLQQIGLVYTTPAKSGFITALYIIMIPIIGLFTRKRASLRVWISVGIAIIGLALLCLSKDLGVNLGDVITLGCAIVFALHIMLVDKYAADMDAILLCAVQFGVGAILSLFPTLFFEGPHWTDIRPAMGSLLYAAVFSGAIGYTLQFYGQKFTPPAEASLLMCLESLFAAIGGWLLLGQALSPREIAGCCLMLFASILVQLPSKSES